jgi:N-acetylglucosaminyldiphosphoundecaprenol N-acetyl-beta-D-mannosaminyltransferase
MPPTPTATLALPEHRGLRLPATAATASTASTASTAPTEALFFAGVLVTETAGFPPAPAPRCWVYVTLNAEIALDAAGNGGLQGLLAQSRARVSVDGQWVWWALKRKYPARAAQIGKQSGSDLIHTLAGHCAEQGASLLLLGSTPAANGGAVMRLRERWPGLQVTGYAPPRYSAGGAAEAETLGEALAAIEAVRADYVVLGLGAHKEHRLAALLAPRLDGRVRGLLCFGGAIDMASGRVARAPRWVQRLGLEGPWRVGQQPARLWRFLRVLRLVPLLLSRRY